MWKLYQVAFKLKPPLVRLVITCYMFFVVPSSRPCFFWVSIYDLKTIKGDIEYAKTKLDDPLLVGPATDDPFWSSYLRMAIENPTSVNESYLAVDSCGVVDEDAEAGSSWSSPVQAIRRFLGDRPEGSFSEVAHPPSRSSLQLWRYY